MGECVSSNESMEMYLETIYLLEKSNGHAHSVDIGKELGVTKASVTKATKHLKEDGYIIKEPYGSINLTKKGRELSKSIYKKHKIITLYLEHTLKVTTKVAEENACRLEHVLTDELFDAICRYLNSNNIKTSF
ncbi:metal-dependent transcriptional regulator [Thiospirochaeta perfilievii]|uniref:Transcriptional regulator MntR n=1 Tax=Thiospirochaeta perfilievii TaxID=252967 RepID=A0A5C1QG08_9SPIO|nr:metal-dependent transcriptional regulator [Thiospirochaeta perfilievii]